MALGVIILQQAHDITDDETLCQLAFNELLVTRKLSGFVAHKLSGL
jgi:hypothetical protein